MAIFERTFVVRYPKRTLDVLVNIFLSQLAPSLLNTKCRTHVGFTST